MKENFKQFILKFISNVDILTVQMIICHYSRYNINNLIKKILLYLSSCSTILTNNYVTLYTKEKNNKMKNITDNFNEYIKINI